MNKPIRGFRAVVVTMAGSLLLLSACVVGPEYRRPVSPSSETYKEQLPSGWKEAEPNDAANRGEWWKAYNDPQLDGLEEQVSVSNQNVLAAEAQYREASATVRGARAQLFPAVSTEPAAARSKVTVGPEVPHSSFSIPLDVIYQADIWGSIRRTAAANSAIAQASAAQLANARLLYQAELAADYFQIQGLDAERRLLDATVKSYEQYVQLTRDRYVGGIASEGDVALAQTQLETARVEQTDLQLQRAQFEHAIAVLTGRPPSGLSIPASSDQSPPPDVALRLPSSLLERRPDIAGAERQVAAANEQIGVAKAALYPALTFSATGGSQTTAIGDLLSWPTRFWSVGPQLAESLFDAGKRKAQVSQARAAYDAAVANYRQTTLTAFQQVEDNLSQLRILSEETEAIDRAVEAAKRTLEISTIQYRGGLASYLQVITAQTSALQNERAAVQIMARRNIASVGLVTSLGGGWNQTLLPSDREIRGRSTQLPN
jgi:NodT family efflux transporter outer membrane factor (OMF) lipoprotein